MTYHRREFEFNHKVRHYYRKVFQDKLEIITIFLGLKLHQRGKRSEAGGQLKHRSHDEFRLRSLALHRFQSSLPARESDYVWFVDT